MIEYVLPWARAAILGLCLTAGPAPQVAAAATDPEKQRVFLQSLELIEAGEYDAAIRLLRAMLRDDPGLHRVRLELARAYFWAKEWARARREFFTVLSADIPDPVRANIIAFLRAIDARRGWDWGLHFALLPGSGLSRRYRSDTVTLDIAGQKLKFDIDRPDLPEFGIEYGGYLEFRETLAEGSDDAPRITGGLRALVAVQDFEGSDFDDHRLRLEAPVVFSYPERTFAVGPVGAYHWIGGDPYETEIGLQAQLTDRSVENWTLVLSGAASRIDNLDDEALDGTRYEASAAAFRSIGGTTIAGASLGVWRLDAAERFESYDEYRAALLLSTDLGYGLTGTFRPAFSWLQFDDTAPLFPEPRRDWQASAFFQLTKADFTLLGFSPFISSEFAYHQSNIELHRYTDHIVRVGFTKAF